ncbi:MAG: hypothetical protein ACC653_13530 [Gammaproteobacteria bacterium]
MYKSLVKSLLFGILSFCFIQSIAAKSLDPNDVPQPLKPWVDWVLYDEDTINCPFLYNTKSAIQCVWPSQLELSLNNTNGKFKQSWLAYKKAWVQIPGDLKRWPQNITVDGKSALVVARYNKPHIQLRSGNHTIKGDFLWETIPENLTIASNTGIIKLIVKGQSVQLPKIQKGGQLWLRDQDIGQVKPTTESDHLEVQVFRKITDEIPLLITTHIELNVSGAHREVLLGKALLDDFIPLSLNSPLPARIEANGRLRIQIRPGHWVIKLTARYPDVLSKITLPRSMQPWPLSEIWVFEARHQNRVVEIKDVQSIDPRQTNLPSSWMNLPAYEMKPDSNMVFKTIRRGDPDPDPNSLNLSRQLWLDFKGTGYTIKDSITGRMTRDWRIESQPELQLGRVTIDNQAQFITQLPNSKNKGVEIRRAVINLKADSRFTASISKIPATGWNHDFQKVNATLHLPPGWKVFSAFGVDNRPDTWLQRWSLLDLFLVLIISITIWRLWGVSWGIIAILTLTMVWHQADSPQFIWLNILAAVALLRVLPKGKIKTIVASYRYISLFFLLIITLPFLVTEIRSGLYPILEFPDQGISSTGFDSDREQIAYPASLDSGTLELATPEVKLNSYKPKKLRQRLSSSNSSPQRQQIAQYDPKANIQTGPGLPEWNWRNINLSWNGPVKPDQQIYLLLLSPNINMALHFLHVVFVSLLVLLMFGLRYDKLKKFSFNPSNIAIGLCLLLISFPSQEAMAESYPSKDLLNQLKQRLLAKPDCTPRCAQISRMKLNIQNNRMTIRLEVHSLAKVAIPLPAHLRNWVPTKILVDGNTAKGIERANDELRISLAKGKHQVILSGALGNINSFQLPLPLKPNRVEVNASGWSVSGILKNAIPDQQLQIVRNQPRASQLQSNSLDAAALPSFVKITRTLHIGLDWRITTRVQRMSSSDNAVVFELPLIKGESVTTEGIRVNKNHVQVSLPVRKNTLSWESVLEKQVQIELVASDTSEWMENWRLDISPVWHVESSGIPVITHFSRQDQWLPEWRPWPGERLTLTILKPLGINGKTLTIDNTELDITPGSRTEDVKLKLSIRSSQGGQHTIVIPNNSKLQSVSINNVKKPIRQNARNVSIPIIPGKQIVNIDWRTDKNFKTLLQSPDVNIGIENVNSTTKIHLGGDRWVLFVGGPRLGPAVLFWGEIILLFFIALGLGKIKSMPLKNYHWFLLGVGLSQIPFAMSIFIIGWLFALLARKNFLNSAKPILFNLGQISLGLLTVFALGFLFFAIQQGLLGSPEMQVVGNQSSAYNLNWYQDRSPEILPTAWVISVPLIAYRLLMLAWALWIAFSLINWLRWGWSCFASGCLWKNMSKPKIAHPATKALATDSDKIN